MSRRRSRRDLHGVIGALRLMRFRLATGQGRTISAPMPALPPRLRPVGLARAGSFDPPERRMTSLRRCGAHHRSQAPRVKVNERGPNRRRRRPRRTGCRFDTEVTRDTCDSSGNSIMNSRRVPLSLVDPRCRRSQSISTERRQISSDVRFLPTGSSSLPCQRRLHELQGSTMPWRRFLLRLASSVLPRAQS